MNAEPMVDQLSRRLHTVSHAMLWAIFSSKQQKLRKTTEDLSAAECIPTEILFLIIEEYCSDYAHHTLAWSSSPRDRKRQFLLSILIRVCRSWYHLLLPVLYRSVLPKDSSEFLNTVKSNAFLGSLVKSFKYSNQKSSYTPFQLNRVRRRLGVYCPNLEELVINTPWDFSFKKSLATLPSTGFLQNLKLLEIKENKSGALQRWLNPSVVLPHLEHLRLIYIAWSKVCQWPTTPRLRYIAIVTEYWDDIQNVRNLINAHKHSLRGFQIHRDPPYGGSKYGFCSFYPYQSPHQIANPVDKFPKYFDLVHQHLNILQDSLENFTFSYPDSQDCGLYGSDPMLRRRSLSHMTSLTTLRLTGSLVYAGLLLEPPPQLQTLVIIIHFETENQKLWTLSGFVKSLPKTLTTVILQVAIDVDTLMDASTMDEWLALYRIFQHKNLQIHNHRTDGAFWQSNVFEAEQVAHFRHYLLNVFSDRHISLKVEGVSCHLVASGCVHGPD